jgi:hypothetical protein
MFRYSFVAVFVFLLSCKSSEKPDWMVIASEGKIIYTLIVDLKERNGKWPDRLEEMDAELKEYDISISNWNYNRPAKETEGDPVILQYIKPGKTSVSFRESGIMDIRYH